MALVLVPAPSGGGGGGPKMISSGTMEHTPVSSAHTGKRLTTGTGVYITVGTVPSEFNAVSACYVRCCQISGTPGSHSVNRWTSYYGASAGDSKDEHTENDATMMVNFPALNEEVRVDFSDLLSNLEAGDTLGVWLLQSTGGNMDVTEAVLEYT